MRKSIQKTGKIILYSVVLASFVFVMSCTSDKNNEQTLTENLSTIDTNDQTNDFYDNVELKELKVQELKIEGEVDIKGLVDFTKLTKHRIIVKEAVLSGDSNAFVGAYTYEGYSLFDILNLYNPKKQNEKEFAPIIDLFVEISNDKGEKVLFSWGEIYYPNHLNEIIIASSVRRIVPSKTKELWTLPEESKIVVGSDLITERNISNPTKIKVISYPKSFVTVKNMKPCFSNQIELFVNDSMKNTLKNLPKDLKLLKYDAIFYGRGRGIHSTTPFNGILFKELLHSYTGISKAMIQNGLVLVVAKDGYRTVFTFSELMNRNDQAEVLMTYDKNLGDGGVFRLFPACDFFSDRAVKAINQIYISKF